MQLKFAVLDDVLRVKIRGRETAQETKEIAERTFAEREKHGVPYRAFTSEADALAWLRSPR